MFKKRIEGADSKTLTQEIESHYKLYLFERKMAEIKGQIEKQEAILRAFPPLNSNSSADAFKAVYQLQQLKQKLKDHMSKSQFL